DPACGSGAFLIEAFDQLYAVFEISNARLEELRGERTLFDLDRQILQHNLYGVDWRPDHSSSGGIAIEVKLCKEKADVKRIVEEISADIVPYRSRFQAVVIVVYDL